MTAPSWCARRRTRWTRSSASSRIGTGFRRRAPPRNRSPRSPPHPSGPPEAEQPGAAALQHFARGSTVARMSVGKTLAMILAGGEGRRLAPLTQERSKPAVTFGGRYRIIDFVLSNFANSGVLRMKVLTQYKSESLNTHISRGWRLSPMLEFHVAQKADCPVAAIPMPIGEASSFGVITADDQGRMIDFQEKPKKPKPMSGNPRSALVSMGNYLFTTEALVREIVQDAGKDSAHDFGKSIITEMHKRTLVAVYDFATNKVPGQLPAAVGYWRDVGDLDTYYDCNMDLVAVDPKLS